MNVIDAIRVAAAANALGVTFEDAITLYQLYGEVKSAGKIDLAAMVKNGTFQADIASVARFSAALNQLLKDKVQGPRVISILESLEPQAAS